MQMIGVSLYLMGSEASLAQLGQGLQVLPQNLLEQGKHSSDFGFYDREENGLFYSHITGDFSYMCDVDLFHVTADQLHVALLALSNQGLVIAKPDEKSPSPFAYVIFEGGQTRLADIKTDEITEEVRIIRPSAAKS
jgi:hypothetical protein